MRKETPDVFKMFGITNSTMRISKLEPLVLSLLHTLGKYGAIDTAINDASKLTPFTEIDKTVAQSVKTVVSIPELVGLHSNTRAVQLLLELLPYIRTTDEYEVVIIDEDRLTEIINRTNKNHVYTELKKHLAAINSLDLGYKVIQTYKRTSWNEFHIIRYDNAEHLVEQLKKFKLMSPSILDRVL
jgi:hypothetical protein